MDVTHAADLYFGSKCIWFRLILLLVLIKAYLKLDWTVEETNYKFYEFFI